ncbi:MAG: hypothetical protein HKN09_13030, partial [Saprospiraceae bacterium]|nr:hypothetical protein [Saprospiraceae bacterium]
MRLILFLSFLFIQSALFGQILDPVKWRYKMDHDGGRQYTLIFEAKIDEGWTVYSQYLEEDGPIPTSINFEPEDGFKKLGDAEELGAKKEGYDEFFGIDVTKYTSDQPFIIKQKIKVDKDTDLISGYLTYMACDKEKCLPPSDVDFRFEVGNEDVVVEGEVLENDDEESGMVDPVQWAFQIEKKKDKYILKYEADIEEGWTVYSQFSSDDGPIPTSINYETEGIVVIDNKEKGKSKKGPDPL